jgi:hypothetical protein
MDMLTALRNAHEHIENVAATLRDREPRQYPEACMAAGTALRDFLIYVERNPDLKRYFANARLG